MIARLNPIVHRGDHVLLTIKLSTFIRVRLVTVGIRRIATFGFGSLRLYQSVLLVKRAG